MSPEDSPLELLKRVNTVLQSTHDLRLLLDTLLNQIVTTFGAQVGAILLGTNKEWTVASFHDTGDKLAQPGTVLYSSTVVNKVATAGCPILAVDALDSSFRCAPSVTMSGMRSIVCVPLRWGGQVQGVLYADHRMRQGAFKEHDLELLSVIGDQASRVLESAVLHEELKRVKQAFFDRIESGDKDASPERVEDVAGAGAVEMLLTPASKATPLFSPSSSDSKGVKLYLLGEFRAQVGDDYVERWPSKKDYAVLCYLALHRGRVITEEELMSHFWPRGDEKARHSLQNCITQIRRNLKDSERRVLLRRLDGYLLSSEVWRDIDQFQRQLNEGTELARKQQWPPAIQALRAADRLVRGPLLEGTFAEWIHPFRADIDLKVSQGRTLLATYFGQKGTPLMAIELWKRVLANDDCDEEAYRGLLSAYRALGRKREALALYQQCRQTLERELQLEPPEDFSALIDF